MVYLGGPRRRRGAGGAKGIYLHDPPPGYRPPRRRVPLKVRQRQAREDYALMRFTTLLLVAIVGALLVMLSMIIAQHL